MARRIRSHAYCSNAGAEGRREADRLNWVCSSPPNNPSWLQAPKVQSAFSLSLLFKSDSGEFNELHDVLECFKYLFEICCRCQTRPGGRGVAPSASLSHAAERPPYIGHKSLFQPKAACKFRDVYFRIESPFARNVRPGTLSALRTPQLAR
jgi:hypothetical protein